jgi:hypothetical protein
VDGVDALKPAQAVDHARRDGGAVDDADDLTAARIELPQALGDSFGLEAGCSVEVGVERREQHPGCTEPQDEDGGPGGDHAPGGPECD